MLAGNHYVTNSRKWCIAVMVLPVPAIIAVLVGHHYYLLHRGEVAVQSARMLLAKCNGTVEKGVSSGTFYIDVGTTCGPLQFAELVTYMHQFPPRHLDQEHTIQLTAKHIPIDDYAIKQLSGLRIILLDAEGTAITDASIDTICSFPLWSLSIANTNISDACVDRLSHLNLMYLNVTDTKISDSGLKKLSTTFPWYTQLLPPKFRDRDGRQLTK